MRYRSKRLYTWSPGIAYSVGLMTSDGCLQANGRHLDMTSTDLEQLENFSRAIGRKLTISLKNNRSRRPAYRIQFSDVSYYDFLLGIGLTPAKSKTLSVLKIPDAYYGHFLRGLFDGDGTTYGYFDPRWQKSFLYYIGFVSASMEFTQFISLNNQRLFGVKGSSVRKSTRSFSLVYGKADSFILHKAMYKDSGTLNLKRKRDKLESFIKADKNATILRTQARVVKLVNTRP